MLPTFVLGLKNPINILEKLKEYNIDGEWFRATNGEKVDDNIINDYINIHIKQQIPRYAIGCAISHMKMWETVLENNINYSLILEDDVIFNDNFSEILSKALEHLPSNFDILYLGCFGCNRKNTILSHLFNFSNNKYNKINDYIAIPSIALALHSYIISKKGATKLLRLLKGKVYTHIDFCMQMLEGVDKYVTIPTIVDQTSTQVVSSSKKLNKHPFLLYRITSHINMDKSLNLNYILSVPTIRILNRNLNLFTLLIFLLGSYYGSIREKYNYVLYVFLVLSSLDFLYSTNYDYILLHFIVYTLGYNISYYKSKI